ncbi:hypothetical protein KKF84_14145, partial [Myxococcota bacterium]|nr:hypothetical protein [Myxococcota bacterium]
MMKIEQGRTHNGEVVLWDAENHDSAFRRVVGGVSWPKGGRSGFIVVVGEKAEVDFGFGVRHLVRLEELREFNGETFLEPEPMFRAMAYLVNRLMV